MPQGNSTQDDPPTFTLFPNLPLELRNQIWYDSLPGPRIIEAACLEALPANVFRFLGAHPPSVLRVCRESRDVALSVYKPFFEIDIVRDKFIVYRRKTPPLIYIDPALDTIYVSTPYGPDGYKRLVYPEFASRYPDVASAQSIAVNFGDSRHISTILTAIMRSPPKNLKEIVLVPGDITSDTSCNVDGSQILFVEPDWDPHYGHIEAANMAREVRATVCPDICVRVMAVAARWALAAPTMIVELDELDDYDSDDLGNV